MILLRSVGFLFMNFSVEKDFQPEAKLHSKKSKWTKLNDVYE